ncbi:MAG: hypothetical protein ACI8V2_003915 [Candidatus Latescibacterota bacterium]|jgi:hypothetical protein
MRQVFLEDAKPGDEVAEPVKNDRGMVILPKGAKLSVPMIAKMRRMGVLEVVIEGDDPNAPPPKTLDELLEDLDFRFDGLEDNKLMMAIKKTAREHLLQRKES